MSNTVDNLLNFGIRVTADDLRKIKKMVFLPNDAGKKMKNIVNNLFLLSTIEKDIKIPSPKGYTVITPGYQEKISELEKANIIETAETDTGYECIIINRRFISDIKNLVKSANAQEKADAAYWEKMARKYQGLYEVQVAETGHVKWLLRAALDELQNASQKAAAKTRITAQTTKKKFQEAAEHFMKLYKKDPSKLTLGDITKFNGIKTRR